MYKKNLLFFRDRKKTLFLMLILITVTKQIFATKNTGPAYTFEKDSSKSLEVNNSLFSTSSTISTEEKDDNSSAALQDEESDEILPEDKKVSDNIISTGDLQNVKEITKPSEEILHKIIDDAYSSKTEFIEKMKNYVVGIKGYDRLMTLDQTYKDKIISAEEAGAILQQIDDLEEGNILRLKMMFGLRSGEDLIVGRYPSQLIARPYGNDAFMPGDPALGPLTKWLQILGHMTWVKPTGAGSRVSIDTSTGFTHNLQISSLSASISTNHYSERHQRSINAGAYASARGMGSSFGWGNPNSLNSVWISANSSWGGLGYTGLYNFEEQQLGLSGIGASAFVAGWKNYAQIGASISAISVNGNQLGIGGVITLSKDRITTYKNKYHGEYDSLIDRYLQAYSKQKVLLSNELHITQKLRTLIELLDNPESSENTENDIEKIRNNIKELDSRISAIHSEKKSFQNKHLIEVIDSKSHGIRVQGGAYAGFVGVGFRGGMNKGSQSIYRFYTDLDRAQELLRDGSPDKIALLQLPKKFDTEKFPDLKTPHLWKAGEEVITNMERTFYGSIVMGATGIPLADIKVGISGTVSGSFEFGVRKLPGNKIEVTIRPKEITEMGAFISSISTIGPQAAASSTVALALRQTFIFDLDNQKAVDKYSLMLTGGILPLEFSLSSGIVGKRESENLLDMAIIARNRLIENGILLTYIEKVDVPTEKFYVGLSKITCLSPDVWAGLSYEFLNGKAKVISTNANIAVSRETSNITTTKAQGTSGIREDGAYATIKRSFAKKESKKTKDDQGLGNEQEETVEEEDKKRGKIPLEDEYTWAFRGITIRATLNDSKVTSNEENQMISMLNSMFHANIHTFPEKAEAYEQSREIFLEREISSIELDKLKNGVKQGIIDTASRASKLGRTVLNDFVAKMENKGHNQMANIVKEFVSDYGIKAVSAVHILTEGNCRNLTIRTQSSLYSDPISEANRFEALYTRADVENDDKQIVDISYDSSERKVRTIFGNIRVNIRKIDRALKVLHSDPFFTDIDDLMDFNDSSLREKKSILRSRLIATKKQLLDLIDLEKQEFDRDSMVNTFKKLKTSDLDYKQKYYLLADKYKRNINTYMTRSEISERWENVSSLIKIIEQEIKYFSKPVLKKIYGALFIEDRINDLNRILVLTKKLITLDHLGNDVDNFVRKLKKKRLGLFPAKPIFHEISGHASSIKEK